MHYRRIGLRVLFRSRNQRIFYWWGGSRSENSNSIERIWKKEESMKIKKKFFFVKKIFFLILGNCIFVARPRLGLEASLVFFSQVFIKFFFPKNNSIIGSWSEISIFPIFWIFFLKKNINRVRNQGNDCRIGKKFKKNPENRIFVARPKLSNFAGWNAVHVKIGTRKGAKSARGE